jgi:hypothetical protein
MTSGWTNWPRCPDAPHKDPRAEKALRCGRRTGTGFCSQKAGARLGEAFTNEFPRAGGKKLLLPAEASNQDAYPTSWSQDGRFILFVRGNPSRQDIWVLPSQATPNPTSLSQTPLMGNSLQTADGWLIPPRDRHGRDLRCAIRRY